jgi:hypothetical protein
MMRDRAFFARHRFEALANMLKEGGLKWSQVTDLLDASREARTEAGFLDIERRGKKRRFQSFHGVKIDKVRGTLEFIATKTTSEVGLFDAEDWALVVRLGLVESLFSLDEIDAKCPYSPLQVMHFLPDSLRDTTALATLFHADYILKFLVCGAEVSAKPPFPLRELSDLLKRAEPNIYKELVDREQGSGKAHRFWITAGSIPTNIIEDQNKVEIVVGSPKMLIKKHVMQRNPVTNEMEDAPMDPGDDSPEGRLALFLTENYERLGNVFPVLLRLRELAKMSTAVRLLLSVKQATRVQLAELPTIKEQQVLELRAKLNNDKKFMIDTALNSLPLHQRGAGAYSEISRALSNGKGREHDELIDRFATRFASDTPSLKSSLKPFIKSWLSGELGADRKLAAQMLQAGFDVLEQGLIRCSKTLEVVQEPAPPAREMSSGPTHTDKKGWIPAAFCKRETSDHIVLVYGGVSINPHVQREQLHPPPASDYYNSGVSLAAQRQQGFPNSTAQIMDNLAFHNMQQQQQQQQSFQRPPPTSTFQESYFQHGFFTGTMPLGPQGGKGANSEVMTSFTNGQATALNVRQGQLYDRFCGGPALAHGNWVCKATVDVESVHQARNGWAILMHYNIMNQKAIVYVAPKQVVITGQAAPKCHLAGGYDQVFLPPATRRVVVTTTPVNFK